MDTGTSTSLPEKGTTALPRRRAPQTRSAVKAPRSIPPALWIALLFVALGVGVAAGVLYMRNRSKARDVVATANGVRITREDFYRRLENVAGEGVLREMVEEEIRRQYAQQKGLTPKAEEIEARFQKMLEEKKLDSTIKNNATSVRDIKRALADQMIKAAGVTQGIAVTDAEVRDFYKANLDRKNPKSLYFTPETVRIAILLVPTQGEAKKAYEAMVTGIDFDKVVKTYSKDQSKNNGGVLPPIQRGRSPATSKLPALEKAIFSMKVGALMPPRQFAGAWWIIRCLDKQAEVIIPFEKVKEECRQGALLLKGLPKNGQKVNKDYDEYHKTVRVQAFWKRYKDAIENK